ncbi:MAG: glutamate racemase [Solitalea-like symbiont of Tyrophagus putrescentiae]
MSQEQSRNNPIAFFDSGIGGLTVLKEMMHLLPFEKYIYFADTHNTPYGVKPPNIVVNYIQDAVAFLYSKNIKMLVIACNTATAIAIEHLRNKYKFIIVGIEPAIKIPFDNKHPGKVLLLATTLTLQSDKLNNLIDSVCLDKNLIVKKPADKLVQFAENFDFGSTDVDKYIVSLFNNINLKEFSTIVLGCTHFSYFKDRFNKIIDNDRTIVIDGNYSTALNACNLLGMYGILSQNKDLLPIDFYGTQGKTFNNSYKDKLSYAINYLQSNII